LRVASLFDAVSPEEIGSRIRAHASPPWQTIKAI
jgi:hypothetical protein